MASPRTATNGQRDGRDTSAPVSPEALRQVRRLQIATKRKVDDLFAGEYHSAFRGLGMEFAEVREYQPGDDVRAIDWNVTARAGRPFIKRFHEERELTVLLAVDLSASGRFGSVERLKSRLAAELCAVLALAATRNNDKVGLLIFTDRVELFVPPRKGQRHMLRVIRELLAFDPQGRGTNIGVALEHLSSVLRRRAIVFLVSDFLDEGYDTALRVLARRHEVVAIALDDPRERELPPAGLIELEDPETGERLVVDTSARSFRRRFAALAHQERGALQQSLRRLGADVVRVGTSDDYAHTLAEFFKRRERRR